eukprot:2023738-Lingulodinium_polyedra.AAC.1
MNNKQWYATHPLRTRRRVQMAATCVRPRLLLCAGAWGRLTKREHQVLNGGYTGVLYIIHYK